MPYRTPNGRDVIIAIDEDAFQIRVFTDPARVEIGGFDFTFVESEPPLDDYLYLTWGFLEGAGGNWKKQGIGRRCLQLATSSFGYPIVAAADDGQRKDDGSHLTGDAPAFVSKMREEGLLH